MKSALFIALAVFTVSFVLLWLVAIFANRRDDRLAECVPPKRMPGPLDTVIGFITNFFDTLGIGSFATTSAFFKFRGLVRDEQIPGTLNVGHTLPSILQAFIYIAVVQVNVVTLILMIAAASVGAWLGAVVVSGLSRRKFQIG